MYFDKKTLIAILCNTLVTIKTNIFRTDLHGNESRKNREITEAEEKKCQS